MRIVVSLTPGKKPLPIHTKIVAFPRVKDVLSALYTISEFDSSLLAKGVGIISWAHLDVSGGW